MPEEYEKVQAPQIDLNLNTSTGAERSFPYTQSDANRLKAYDYNEMLFDGRHFEAFRVKIDNLAYGEVYSKLRYVKANFAGLVSKVCADFLFGEPIKIKVPDGDQEFVDALIEENSFMTQLYESALTNSFMGDDLFKLRVGRRHRKIAEEKLTVIIEETTPKVYFPDINAFNVREEPSKVILAWTFEVVVDGKKNKYLREEIHEPEKITNKVYRMEGDKIKEEVGPGILGLVAEEATKSDRPLVFHIPNWKIGGRFFGLSDYYDLENIFYAINNRLTKNDNILDKHSDPILAVPEGILDEKGQVKRGKLNMVEKPVGSGDDGKPEYIVWNANMEYAFKQIETLIDMLFMLSEISPDVLGKGEGQSDSGRALKLKIMRTLAKINRKKLYYDKAIKDIVYYAQVLAKEWQIEINGKKLSKPPVRPEIEWADGMPIDELEQVEIETQRLDNGTQDVVSAIMNIDGVDEDSAEEKAKKIKEDRAIAMPQTNLGNNPFKKDGMKSDNMQTTGMKKNAMDMSKDVKAE